MSTTNKNVLFSGVIGIDYGQFYIDNPEFEIGEEDDYLEPDGAFEGQKNGICGSSQAGKIFFVVGPQSGMISIDIELSGAEPDVNQEYDEIVEVGFERGTKPIALCEWGCEETYPLEIPSGKYSVRYSIQGMDRDYGDEDEIDAPIKGQKHLIQIWPSENPKEGIIKVSTETASYWHKEWGGG